MSSDVRSSGPPRSKVRRRTFTFSLSTLFVLITGLCLWIGYHVNRATAQRRAVGIVRQAGGTIHYQHEAHHWPLPDTDFSSSSTFDARVEPSAPRWLRKTLGDEFFMTVAHIGLAEKQAGTRANLEAFANLSDLRWLDLGSNNVDDQGLLVIGTLKNLQVLHLNRNRITDQGLQHLVGLEQLESLDLSMNSNLDGSGLVHVAKLSSLKKLDLQITGLNGDALALMSGHPNLEILMVGQTPLRDEHLRHLATLPKLLDLGIDRTEITDEGLAFLADHARLHQLYLEGPEITDRGLRHLSRMKSLKYLALWRSQITDAGVAELQSTIPGCRIAR